MMTKSELIERIADRNNISESEQKLFFELFLKRCAEVLNPDESMLVSDLGEFHYRKTYSENETDFIVFVTNDNRELQFDVPQDEKENFPIDSYFSISIGKPVIPLKGSEHPGFSGFISQSGDEMNRLLGMKVEKFIEESSKTKIEEEEKSDIADIHFSFLNWKKSSNLNEEIKKIEDELQDSFSSEVNETVKIESDIEEVIEAQPSFEKTDEIETFKVFDEEFNEPGEKIEPDVNDSELIQASEELAKEDQIDNEELMESTGEWIDGLSQNFGTKNPDEEISEETKNNAYDDFELSEKKEEDTSSFSSKEEKVISDDDSSVINEAFKFAEEKKARIESYRKRSYGGFIFAAVIIIATAAVIYFSYYFTDSDELLPVTSNNDVPKEFNTVINRTFDIPISYPYQPGMFAGIYDAISDDVLNSHVIEDKSLEQNNEITGNSNSKSPDIRSSLPSKRIKDYIYQYNDGTFAIQLSSWKSKTVALSETQKLLSEGHNAFVEETSLSGGTYYRVRVGGFNSLAEAETFSRK